MQIGGWIEQPIQRTPIIGLDSRTDEVDVLYAGDGKEVRLNPSRIISQVTLPQSLAVSFIVVAYLFQRPSPEELR